MKILKVVMCCALAVVACGCGKKKHESSSSGGGGRLKLPSFAVKSEATSVATNGRKLYVAIQEANTSRKSNGLTSTVWPKSSDDRDEDEEDIAGMDFTDAAKYFEELFDVKNYGKKDRRSYVGDLDLSVLAGGGVPIARGNVRSLEGKNVGWCVLKGLRDEMEDAIPVLVTANVNVRDLITTGEFDGKSDRKVGIGENKGAARDMFDNRYIVIVRKGGAVDVIEAEDATLSRIYGNMPFSVPSDAKLEYLKMGR